MAYKIRIIDGGENEEQVISLLSVLIGRRKRTARTIVEEKKALGRKYDLDESRVIKQQLESLGAEVEIKRSIRGRLLDAISAPAHLNLQGVVREEGGSGVSGLEVHLSSPDAELYSLPRRVETDEFGAFEIEDFAAAIASQFGENWLNWPSIEFAVLDEGEELPISSIKFVLVNLTDGEQVKLLPNGTFDWHAFRTDVRYRVHITLSGPESPSPVEFSVEGTIRNTDGESLSGMGVRAFDMGVREERLLAEGTTDEEGNYALEYTETDLSGPGEKRADLVVRVYDGSEEVIAQSDIVPNADPAETIDFEIETTPEQTEFERLVSLMPALSEDELAVLTDGEIVELKNELELDSRAGFPTGNEHIDVLIAAARLSEWVGVETAVLYGIGRMGHSLEPKPLLASDSETIESALVRAIRDEHIVPDVDVEASLARLYTPRTDYVVGRLVDVFVGSMGGSSLERFIEELETSQLERYFIHYRPDQLAEFLWSLDDEQDILVSLFDDELLEVYYAHNSHRLLPGLDRSRCREFIGEFSERALQDALLRIPLRVSLREFMLETAAPADMTIEDFIDYRRICSEEVLDELIDTHLNEDSLQAVVQAALRAVEQDDREEILQKVDRRIPPNVRSEEIVETIDRDACIEVIEKLRHREGDRSIREAIIESTFGIDEIRIEEYMDAVDAPLAMRADEFIMASSKDELGALLNSLDDEDIWSFLIGIHEETLREAIEEVDGSTLGEFLHSRDEEPFSEFVQSIGDLDEDSQRKFIRAVGESNASLIRDFIWQNSTVSVLREFCRHLGDRPVRLFIEKLDDESLDRIIERIIKEPGSDVMIAFINGLPAQSHERLSERFPPLFIERVLSGGNGTPADTTG